MDETGEFNWVAVRKMGPMGMLGLQVPEAHGAAALDAICATIAIEEPGWACGSTALAISAHNHLGMGPLVEFGSDAPRRSGCLLATGAAGWLPHAH